MRIRRPRARRHRRRRGAPRGRAGRPRARRSPLAPVPALRQLGALAAARARRRREHRPTAIEIEVPLRGKALRDKVVLRLIAIDRAFHFTILVLLGVAVLAVRRQREEPARRLLPDPHRPPGRRRRRPGPEHRPRRDPARARQAVLAALRNACARSGSRCWPTGCSRESRPSACGSRSAGPSTSRSSRPRSCCRSRSTRSSTAARLLKIIGFIINLAVVDLPAVRQAAVRPARRRRAPTRQNARRAT